MADLKGFFLVTKVDCLAKLLKMAKPDPYSFLYREDIWYIKYIW